MKQFLLNNKWSILIGVLVYSIFTYYTYTGSRFCDCQTTEKYNSTNTRSIHGTVNRFYHK